MRYTHINDSSSIQIPRKCTQRKNDSRTEFNTEKPHSKWNISQFYLILSFLSVRLCSPIFYLVHSFYSYSILFAFRPDSHLVFAPYMLNFSVFQIRKWVRMKDRIFSLHSVKIYSFPLLTHRKRDACACFYFLFAQTFSISLSFFLAVCLSSSCLLYFNFSIQNVQCAYSEYIK